MMGNAPERIWVGTESGKTVGVDWSEQKVFDQDVEYVCADLAPAPSWQPIETAPKDGTRILVYRTPEMGYASMLCGVDMMKQGKWWYSRRDMQPTHWMPLPAPPEAS